MRRALLAAIVANVGVVFLLLVTLCYGQVSVLTQRNDLARDGLNANETALTLSSVSIGNFGKLFNLPVDGYVYAQPLYVPNVVIPGNGTHNVVYVATQHDTLFAYDADGQTLQPLWKDDLGALGCPGGWTCTPVPYSDNPGVDDIVPEVGITSTPVIEPSTGTIYVVAKTQQTLGSTTNYVYQLHALDITTGAERVGSPVVIQGQVAGSGNPNSNGFLVFSPRYSLQRASLTLVNNGIYIGFGSWGDAGGDWHGWIFGYDKSTLTQLTVFSATPNGNEGRGGVWMHGAGLAADSTGYLYFSTANGAFDGIANFGDSFLKLATPSLTVSDYFTPYNQQTLDTGDLDVASGSITLLPDSAGTAQHTHIMIGCGKNGAIYVLDRDSMGHFNSPGDTQIIQELLNVIGATPVDPLSSNYVNNCFTSAAYWQGHVYFGGVGDSLKMFNFSNGLLSSSAVSQSAIVYGGLGTNASISANGGTNGIVWTNESVYDGTAVLHGYDATNLSNELYNSSSVPSDAAGAQVKFTVPTIANGKVYVGTQTSVAVYGLLSGLPQAAAPSFSIPGGTYSSPVTVTITEATAGTTVYYTTDGSTPTTSSNVYTGPITISVTTTLSAMAVGGGYRSSPITTATYVIGGSVAIGFAQVAAATPASATQVTVAYPGAQTIGNLNVVVVGWNDTTATVQSVTDSAGNSYSLAIGPTSGTGLRQSIYYAANIKGGSNTVTVMFNQSALYPDVRILEYQGVGAVDVKAGASGNSGTANSGSATTTTANELIFGAATVSSGVTGAGSGFTSRIITASDGDNAEDEVVTTIGSYSATAPLNPSAPWVMQMVAFKAASSSPAPTVSSVSPSSGPAAGGTVVSITGTNFVTGATVTLGGTAATNVVVVSASQITATTAAHAAGAVNVVVTNPDMQTGSLTNGFTYVAAPTVSSVSPSSGPAAGGTAVTVTGTNFVTGATVTLGGTAATNVVVVSAGQITATTAAHAAGAVNVVVTNPDTQTGTLTNGFTYTSPTAPTVTSVSPSSGPAAGGTAVSITGTNFVTGATVTLGGTAATNVVVVSASQITATTAAHAAGAVNVVVTNPDTQAGSLTNGFTYVAAPTVSSVSPSSGPAAGGTAVTVTGTNFVTGATVTLGGTAATNVVVVSAGQITATTAAHAAGAVNVVVTNPDTQTGTLTNGFTYTSPTAPTVTSVSPSSGPAAGGTAVSITGTNFVTGATVTLGGTAATNVVVVSASQITATTAAHAAGAVNVVVTNSDTQTGTLTNGYTYTTSVAISFAQVAAATPASATQVTVAYPGAQTIGNLNVVVVGWNDTTATVQSVTDSAGNSYSLAIGPTSGTGLRQSIYYAANIKGGSNTVTVMFNQSALYPDVRILEYQGVGAVDVKAGASGNSGTANSGSATTTTANELIFGAATVSSGVTGAGSGFTSRIITASDGDNAEDEVVTTIGSYSATAPLNPSAPWVMQMVAFKAASSSPAPTVSSVSPSSGPAAGGTVVSITGTNFVTGATVTLGGTAATNVVVVSASQITATTAAHAAGAVNVVVTNPDMQTGSLTNGFTYVAAPTVSSVSPSSGPAAGGTAVTVTGTNFVTGATVTLGGTAATNVVVVSAGQITATTAAHAAGAVNVVVTNPDTQTGTLTNGFTYTSPTAPTVTSVSPSSGPAAGGTAVSITGTNFVTGATVTLGGTAATNVVVVSASQITATTAAHAAGAVNVVVTNPDTQAGSLTNGFTYVAAPTVSSVSPSSGPAVGGTAVSITGTNFVTGATVTLGGTAATNVVVVSASQITATTAAHAAGAVNVVVTNPDTQTGTLTNGYTYTTSVAISFAQVAAATPASATQVTVAYPGAQTIGNLNVVVVGWNDTTATVQSVTDSAGNPYSLAIGPTSGTKLRQSIYYAANIKGGSNTVTVMFNQSALYPDVRILEYQGVGAVDVKAGANGNSRTANSGSATTTTVNELIFGAATVSSGVTGAGSGFTSRIITASDGDNAEDRVVTTIGSYSATAPLNPAGAWVMQMVAFK